MQAGKSLVTTLDVRFTEKEITVLAEIGLDEISTATSFVEYLCERHQISRSGAWYCLKKLKKEGVVDFTEKGEEYKPLRMTEQGLEVFRHQVSHTKLNTQNLPMVRIRAMF